MSSRKGSSRPAALDFGLDDLDGSIDDEFSLLPGDVSQEPAAADAAAAPRRSSRASAARGTASRPASTRSAGSKGGLSTGTSKEPYMSNCRRIVDTEVPLLCLHTFKGNPARGTPDRFCMEPKGRKDKHCGTKSHADNKHTPVANSYYGPHKPVRGAKMEYVVSIPRLNPWIRWVRG